MGGTAEFRRGRYDRLLHHSHDSFRNGYGF